MSKCKRCGKDTDNPSFCSRSCSVSINNKGKRRHGREPGICKWCGKKLNWSGRKFCSRECIHLFKEKDYIQKWLTGKITGCYSNGELTNRIRKWLIRESKNRCRKCSWGKINKKTGLIPLTIDHKDGNPRNHKRSNLIVLCPNCHSLTPSYGGANKGNGRSNRRGHGVAVAQ